jgi:hypothetical protein
VPALWRRCGGAVGDVWAEDGVRRSGSGSRRPHPDRTYLAAGNAHGRRTRLGAVVRVVMRRSRTIHDASNAASSRERYNWERAESATLGPPPGDAGRVPAPLSDENGRKHNRRFQSFAYYMDTDTPTPQIPRWPRCSGTDLAYGCPRRRQYLQMIATGRANSKAPWHHREVP